MSQTPLIFDSSNFLTRKQVYEFVDAIPKLKCYKVYNYGRRPLPEQLFQLLVEQAYEGCMRIMEPTMLTPKNIDFKYLEATLDKAKTGWRFCKCAEHVKKKMISCNPECPRCKGIGKIYIPQYVDFPFWLSRKTEELIRDFKIKPTSWLFASPSFPKQPISYDFLYDKCIEVGEMLNLNIYARYSIRRIKHVYTHIFRRSKIIQMDLDGFTPGEIAAKARHIDVKTTTTYMKPSIDVIKRRQMEIYGKTFEEYEAFSSKFPNGIKQILSEKVEEILREDSQEGLDAT